LSRRWGRTHPRRGRWPHFQAIPCRERDRDLHSGKGQAAVSGPPVLFVFARSDPTRNRGGLTVSTLTGTAPRTIARRSGLIDTPGGSVRRLRIFLLALLAPRHPMARAGAVQQRIAMPLQRLGGRLRRRPVGLPGLLSL